MTTTKSTYKIYIGTDKKIVLEKVGSKLNIKEREILVQHGFAPCYASKHHAECFLTDANINNTIKLGKCLNLIGLEKLVVPENY
jgi:hypothetical protein